ncbi:hypothetical protein RB195_011739 [Necator americanus]|uniref:IBR domain protein n=1 Tax=Necator americanus TaxID=51031 RepID=A0ABR1D4V8_NECAM
MPPWNHEGYQHDYESMVNKGPRGNNGRRRRYDRYPGKKVSDQTLISKTVYDPQNTLSKRAYKRLRADQSDGFCLNVSYSLNRKQRWKTINPASLLSDNPPWFPEPCIVSREFTPFFFRSDDSIEPSITRLQFLNDDVLTTFSSAGTKKTIRHYIIRVNEKRETEKDEVEPARVLFNIIKPPRLKCHVDKRFKEEKWIPTPLEDPKFVDWDEVIDCSPALEERLTDLQISAATRRAKLTLGDFISDKPPSISSRRAKSLNCTSDTDDSFEFVTMKPAKLCDISKYTNAPHIFEIFDINMKDLGNFDLQEEVALHVPSYWVVQWFGSERVSIASQSMVQLNFVLFFEILKEFGVLRIRLNINSQFSAEEHKIALGKLLRKEKNSSSLFKDLVGFIFRLEPIHTEKEEENRFDSCKNNFPRKVNSEEMAVVATRCNERDQLEFVRPFYSQDGVEFDKSVENGAKCSNCNSSNADDLFMSTDGMMCRQCVAAFMIRQLRLNHAPPLCIPLSGSTQSSSIDLLYAVLPLPVMSLIVKKSYLHHFRLMYPQSRLLQCPQCSISLVIKELSEFNCCICSYCGCCWCYLCNCEPHWPLTCKQFKEWNKKWETQYLFEKFNLDVGERLLCIKCCCEGIFYAAENSAHGTLCSNFNKKCWRQYDKDGLMRPKFDLYWPYTPRFRKEFHKPDEDEFFKNGTRVHPEYLEPKKLVKKEFAAICAEARSLRFDEKKQRNFEEEVCKIFDDEAMQQRAIGIRKTALTLVENCTALLYLHRAENNQHLKRKVSRLFHLYLIFEEAISSHRQDFNAHFANLDKELSDVIISFRHYLVQEQPQVLL